MERKEKIKDFFSRDVLQPSNVIAEILTDGTTSRSHFISQFDLRGEIFQSKTPPITGVAQKVWKTININETTCTYSK